MHKIIQNSGNKYRYFSGVNTFWTVLNNKAAITRIKNLNKQVKGESMITFGFSTLYTKVTYNKLFKMPYEWIDFCFD